MEILSPSLPESTLTLLEKTLSYYATISINLVYVFTSDLELVGSLDISKSTPLPLNQCVRMGDALSMVTRSKANNVTELDDIDGTRLICHTIDGFIFLYAIRRS
ncbi:uncharacterized protein SPAPADRAFT_60189 [Spathaspora passalidarum NRRL Y-27907]|uniref:Uncharacterized protein n=1 Tax=Spathaspora passalidarum (strain NRRL Y-27907 / 11-Y1) TaxID=619300 RepID=G3AK36_SPAPN|nr:uncharacterized protein SPAPADRAFT_60189 [Spathaspora passalidarum NRRL Y-27907]EGW32847.1 hypothetical protein SPAPADRAFT_60189 [Spathaspora passalidarum NRRL Y-27907]